jgi:hypothetical protein
MEKDVIRFGLLVAATAVAFGCSTPTRSTLAGGAIGAGAGGLAGSFLPGNTPQNIVIGSIAGGTLGALSGALIHKSIEDKERDSYEKGKKDSKNDRSSGGAMGFNAAKRWLAPRLERRWKDEELLEGGKVLDEGHYQDVVVEEGHWE